MAVKSEQLRNLNGREKAAMLLITLGPERSAQIFKHLKEEEIEQLTLEIANIRAVSPAEREGVLSEFYQLCLAQQYITEGGIGYAKDILEKALGIEKTMEIINKLTVSLQVRPFDFVRKADPSQVLNFIQSEHPQTIALILAYMKPAQAAAVLSALPQDKQADVAKRIATMDRTSPEIIKEVERVLEKKLSNLVTEDFTAVGGIQAIVDVLNSVDREQRNTSWIPSRLRMLTWLRIYARECLYLRIFYSLITGLFSVSFEKWTTACLPLRLKVPPKRFRMSYTIICPSVWRK